MAWRVLTVSMLMLATAAAPLIYVPLEEIELAQPSPGHVPGTWYWGPIWRAGVYRVHYSNGANAVTDYRPVWPVILGEQVIVLVLGGGILASVVRRERRRKANLAG